MSGRNARQKLLFCPTAAQSFDKLNGGDQALARQLGVRAFRRQGIAACVHDFYVSHDAGAILVGCESGGAPRILHRAFLCFRLVG